MLTKPRTLVPFTLAGYALATLVLAAPTAASDRPDKPQMRTSAPSHVDAPTDHHDKERPARVRPASSPASDKAHTGKVNINHADVKELMTLAGVGRKVAEKIVEYRDTHGPFKKSDELRKVDGVGTGVWEKNRDRIVTK